MKKFVDDERLIYKCCSLYYEDEKSQQEICALLGISRPSVSRMLKQGRELGIVRLEVCNPDKKSFGTLERQLEKTFRLKEAVVVENKPMKAEDEHISQAMAVAALQYLSRIIHEGERIGVTMGVTLRNIVQANYAVDKSIHCTFVPILGGVGESRMEIYSNYLAAEFAKIFGGECLQFFSPAFFSNKAVLEGFKEEALMRHYFDGFHHIDVVIGGIGSPEKRTATTMQVNYIDTPVMDAFIEDGLVGDYNLQFFDINGRSDRFRHYNERVAGMSLEQIRTVPSRIGVAGGIGKVKSVYGAIAGQYVNILITDESCAKGLLRLF